MSESTVTASRNRSAELALLIEQVTSRLQAGEPVDPEEIARDHPDHVAELRELLPAMALLVNLSQSGRAAGLTAEGPLGELGDFRLMREVGRGGMGIVYEAEQISLNRRVALKVLPYAATMDPKQLQRFKNESRAAASLRHEHIVHVYGVGCERGVHYYAMEFIDGLTLAQIISWRAGSRERPEDCPESATKSNRGALTQPGAPDTDPLAALSTQFTGPKDREFYRTAARLIADAADALEHAHALGIVHRDVKPGNLLVDAAGKVWVADFGLARLGSEAGLTMSGDLLGTLRYMAPEQALTRHGLLDHRADVYALGATLYELLTGRPAVDAEDRAEVLRKIAFEEPAPPRKIDKSIPAELETIALKCLAKNLNDRYATAGDLADDLRRWLNDQAIQAKPPGFGQRTAKWARRHRAALAVSLLVLFGALAALAAFLWREKQFAEQSHAAAEAARLTETDLRERVEENLRLALKSLDSLFIDEGEERLASTKNPERVNSKFLVKGLEFYEKFARVNAADPAMRREAGRAYSRVGVLHWLLGRHAQAEEATRKGIDLLEASLARPEPEREDFLELINAYVKVGLIRFNSRKFSDSELAVRRALDLTERMAVGFPGDAECRRQRAHNTARLGVVLARVPSRRAEAASVIQAATELGRVWVGESPESAAAHSNLGVALYELAGLRPKDGDRREAIRLVRQAIEHQQAAVSREPDEREFRYFLSNHWERLAVLLEATGDRAESVDCRRQVVALREKLTVDFPNYSTFPSTLAAAQHNLALKVREQGDLSEARRLLEEAVRHQRVALQRFPGVPNGRESLREHYYVLAGTFVRLKDHQAAAVAAQQIPSVFPQSAADNLRAARGLGRCAALAANDAGLSRERRAELADDYGRHSVDFLRRATERGYRNLNFLKTDSALAPVRSRDDFQKLLQELEIPR